MLKLCHKDYLASRWLWLLPLAVYFLYSIQTVWRNIMLMALGAGLILGCLIITLILEDRNKTEALYGSLPVKRSTIVKGRYLLAGFLTVAGGAVIFLSLILMNAFLKTQRPAPGLKALLTLESGVGFVVSVSLVTVFYLPLYFRFGFGRGSAIFAAASVGLALVLGILERLAGRWFGFHGSLFGPEFLKDLGGAILGAIGQARAALGPPLFIASILLGLSIMIFFSVRISVRFYGEREF